MKRIAIVAAALVAVYFVFFVGYQMGKGTPFFNEVIVDGGKAR